MGILNNVFCGVTNFASKVRSKVSFKMMMILVTIVALIWAIIFVYKKYLVPKMNPTYAPNKEFVEKGVEEKDVEMIIFTVDWCPYCKKAMPVWNEFVAEYDGKTVDGYRMNFNTVNCTDENDAEVKAKLSKFNVEGYPTIVLVKDGEPFLYDAKPEKKTMEKFIHEVLG